MSAARPLSELLDQWGEIDATLRRVTGKSYDQLDPGWYEREGRGLDSALAFVDSRRHLLTEQEAASVKWFRRRAELPGAREAARNRIRTVARLLHIREQLLAEKAAQTV